MPISSDRPKSRATQRPGGTLLAAIGTGSTAWMWHRALDAGIVYLKASMLFPAIAVVGAGLIPFPGYREEKDRARRRRFRPVRHPTDHAALVDDTGPGAAGGFVQLHSSQPLSGIG